MQTFSALWTPQLGRTLKMLSREPYSLEFHAGSDDYSAFESVVAQGIDSHLEAIFFNQEPGLCGRRRFIVDKASVPVLVRRLIESGDDNAGSLASAICSTLGIELI